jgi:glycosylphosphatidylinositol transamidase
MIRCPDPKKSQTLDDVQTFVLNLSLVLPASVLYIAISPPVVLHVVQVGFLRIGVEGMLVEMARGWVAQGVWTGLVVWGIWWPSWVIGGMGMWSGCFDT